SRFTQLKEAHINCNHVSSYQFPLMDTSMLEKLVLGGTQHTRAWAHFSSDSTSQVVEFPVLKHLQLTRTGYEDRAAGLHNEHPWQLQFPMLRDIFISNLSD
ncbi:hypothetical protein LPJ61_006297, partial [Coemansia biformis]